MMRNTTLFALLVAIVVAVASTDAFSTMSSVNRKPAFTTSSSSSSALKFGFLKELGLEKPSWLPDFGGKKEEDPAPATEATEEDAEEPVEAEASE